MDNSRFMTAIRYWWAFCLIAGIGALSILLEPYVGYRAVGFFFLIGVLATGAFNTLGPVLFAATFSTLIWNFAFIPPKFTFAISQAEDFTLSICYFVAAVVTGMLTSRSRLAEKLATDREERTLFLYEVLKDILECSRPEDFMARITMRVEDLLGGKCRIELGNIHVTGSSSHRVFSVKGRGAQSGILIYENAVPLKPEQSELLESVSRQLGLSLERLALEKRLREAKRLEDSEHLHQTLLNSVSHELRTPLTALMGFASSLNDEKASSSPDFRRLLAQGLLAAGERMNRVVENLLDMSRLSSKALTLRKEWHDVNDLIGVVLNGLRPNLKNHSVSVTLPENYPLLEMDFHLMEHALANLILNAAAYSPEKSKIEISASINEDYLELSVIDEGPGIPLASLPHIFEKFYRAPGTPPGGTGLGLSIAKSIVNLHGGSINAENNEDRRGAHFSILMPLGTPPRLPTEVANG